MSSILSVRLRLHHPDKFGDDHMGSLEMGLEFAPMLDRIKQSYNLEGAAFIEKKMLREIGST